MRESNASKAGLDAEVTQEQDGTWTAVLSDDQGRQVYESKGHVTQRATAAAVRKWVSATYLMETEEAKPKPTYAKKRRPYSSRPPTGPPPLGPGASGLVEMMQHRANDNEAQAVSLRIQADGLEAEAKRLRAAAETLEGGPEV